MRVEWSRPDIPTRVRADATFPFRVEFRNAGDQPWPAADSGSRYANGRHAVRLAHRWCGTGGENCTDYLSRFNLPASLAPGATVSIGGVVSAPSRSGDYELQFDLVQ